MSAIGRAALFALVAALPGVAVATEYRDAETGFRIAVEFPGSRVCVLKPDALLVASGCEGLAVAAAKRSVAPELRLMALVRAPDGALTVMNAMTLDRSASSGEFTIEDSLSFAAGEAEGLRKQVGSATVARAVENVNINGLQVFHFLLETEKPPLDAMVCYVVVSRTTLIQVQLMGNRQQLPSLEKRAAALMQTASLSDPPAATSWTSNAYQAGYRIGRLIGNLVVLAMLCVGAVWIYRMIRRRRRAAAVSSSSSSPDAR